MSREQRMQERTACENDKHLRLLVDNMGDMISRHLPDSTITYVSPSCRALLGYTQEELVHTRAADHVVPDTLRDVESAIGDAVERHDEHYRVQHGMKCKDGSSVWVETVGSLLYGADSELLEIQCIARDITERKRAEEKLQASEENYRTIFDSGYDSIIVHDMDTGAILDVNHRMCEMFGYTRAEALSVSVGAISLGTSPYSMQEASEWIHKASTESPQTFEWICVKKNGEGFWGDVTLKRVVIGGHERVLATTRDITDRKYAEKERETLITKLEAQNAELERFTYTVSHDLKSPLITIKGFAGMLRRELEGEQSEQAADGLSRISQAADKMDCLLRDLLELSRVGRLANPSENVSLKELAHEARDLVDGQARRGGTRVEISPDLPAVYGDRTRLLEVFQNLIDNAAKYMGDEPHPLVEIGVRRDENQTVCYVRDNGIGIPPRFHERVFGLFNQLDPKVEGTGIGLALVKRIIEVHGGRIWIESPSSGHGSTFCFTLPARTDSWENR